MNPADIDIIPSAAHQVPIADLRRQARITVTVCVREVAVCRVRDRDDTVAVANLRNAITALLKIETEIAQHNRSRMEGGK